jgi:hypothetical protein
MSKKQKRGETLVGVEACLARLAEAGEKLELLDKRLKRVLKRASEDGAYHPEFSVLMNLGALDDFNTPLSDIAKHFGEVEVSLFAARGWLIR